MIPYLARLLDITMNNGTLPADWKRALVFPVPKGVDHERKIRTGGKARISGNIPL